MNVQKLLAAKQRLLERSADMPIIVDPLGNWRFAARPTLIGVDFATKETSMTTKKTKPKKFNTIGVRFIGGHSPEKIYTYKVRIGAKVYLGQELIADTARGPAAVVVVRTDKTSNQFETYPTEGLKYIEKKAVAL